MEIRSEVFAQSC